jgi:hypothetical protein
MSIPTCEHIKPSGNRCGSPALKDQNVCYYHARLHLSLPVIRNMYIAENKHAEPGEYPVHNFPVPELEDAAAIQIGFMQALHGVANGRLDPRRAKLVLSALHGARMNLKSMERSLEACLRAANGSRKKPPASVRKPKSRAQAVVGQEQ